MLLGFVRALGPNGLPPRLFDLSDNPSGVFDRTSWSGGHCQAPREVRSGGAQDAIAGGAAGVSATRSTSSPAGCGRERGRVWRATRSRSHRGPVSGGWGRVTMPASTSLAGSLSGLQGDTCAPADTAGHAVGSPQRVDREDRAGVAAQGRRGAAANERRGIPEGMLTSSRRQVRLGSNEHRHEVRRSPEQIPRRSRCPHHVDAVGRRGCACAGEPE
jgi:hypothetical protein